MPPEAKNDKKTADAVELRRKAEESLVEHKKTDAPLPMMNFASQRLVHELEVHQIELEMQNEELKQAQVELDTVLQHYSDLYDFAPTGYLTLARDGSIRMVNLMGAELLGLERSQLLEKRFTLFVAEAFRTSFINSCYAVRG